VFFLDQLVFILQVFLARSAWQSQVYEKMLFAKKKLTTGTQAQITREARIKKGRHPKIGCLPFSVA
jgi:hypothetical protein